MIAGLLSYEAERKTVGKLAKANEAKMCIRDRMNARVRKMLEGAIQSDGIEELFETGKHISVDIFSDEYMDKKMCIRDRLLVVD